MRSLRHIARFAIPTVFAFIVSTVNPQTAVEESLLEDAEDAEELLEQMENWRKRPIDLNRASLTILQELPVLSPLMAEALVQERNRGGAFHSLSDAWQRLGWDERTREILRPYLTVSRRAASHRDLHLRERLITRFPKASGYSEGDYEGGPWKSMHRVTTRYSDNLRAGVFIEKDAGERQWNDHWVGYIETAMPDLGLQAVLGHYRVEVGQGLVFWGPYGLTKGADPIAPVKKRPKRCRGYASADENHFFTGAALTLHRGGLALVMFASRTRLDAGLRPDGSATSLTTTGLHRNDLEREKKDNLPETLYGGRIEASGDWGTVGLTGRFSRYATALSPEDPERYAFAFEGRNNHVVGIDFDIRLDGANLSGEAAISRSGGWAVVVSAIARVKSVDLAMLIRRYAPDFHNPHSRSFGSSAAQNDAGIYLGFRGKITPSTSLSLFCDIARKPWRTYAFPTPSNKSDVFGQLEHGLSGMTWLLKVRWRQSDDIRPGSSDWRPTEVLGVRNHRQIRWECRFHPTSRIDLKSRIETVQVARPRIVGEIQAPSSTENGLLMYQDVRVRPGSRWSLALRWITFDTPSYDSRIYEFESDLPGILTTRPLYGKGVRWYVLLKRNGVFLDVSVKFGATRRDGIDSWGTGSDEIPGDTIRDLSVQADVRF